MKPGFFQGKKFPFTPKRRKKSLGSQCNNIIDTRHDLAAFRSKLANVSWLRSYIGLTSKALGMKCLLYFGITSMKQDTSAQLSGRGELHGRLGL